MSNQYRGKNVGIKLVCYLVLLIVFALLFLFGILIMLIGVINISSGMALGEVFFTIGMGAMLDVVSIYPVYRFDKLCKSLINAIEHSKVIAKLQKPLISIEEFYMKQILMTMVTPDEIVSAINDEIKHGYLTNCTIEFHDEKPYVALAKKVVKDKCPNCGAPITGVYNKDYVCKYCGKRINDVIEKKF